MPPAVLIHRVLIVILLCGSAAPANAHPPALDRGPNAPTFGVDARTEDTIEFLTERIAARPEDTLALGRLGSLHLEVARRSGDHGRLVEAERIFGLLLEVSPGSAAAHHGLAYCLLGRHRFHDALEQARRLAQSRPDSPETWALLGDIHLALGHYAEADAFFRRLHEHALTLQSFARMALMHEHHGRFDEARQSWRHAIAAGELLDSPVADRAWCFTILGDLELRTGRLEDAEEAYLEALRLDRCAHVASWRLAQVRLERGEIESARDVLGHLVQQYPKTAYWITLGEACLADDDEAAARGWFDRAESHMHSDVLDGDLAHARELVELWLAHGRDPDTPQRAVELALRDLRETRQDAEAFELAAWALHHAGRHDEAVEMIDEALRRKRHDARVLARASAIHDAAGTTALATPLLQAARRIDPRTAGVTDNGRSH